MLDIPDDSVLENFFAHLAGNSRIPWSSALAESRYRPWAAYFKFVWRRAGRTPSALARWIKTMVPRSDPFREVGRLAEDRLNEMEKEEAEKARQQDAERFERFRRNQGSAAAAAVTWRPRTVWGSASSSSSSLASSSGVSVCAPPAPSAAMAAPPMPHIPPLVRLLLDNHLRRAVHDHRNAPSGLRPARTF